MKTQSDKDFAGTIWKFGCNWGGMANPSFYKFIKKHSIVIGRERCRYAKDDLVVITEGFTVRAIAKVKEEPKSITENPSYAFLQQEYGIDFEDTTIYAKAEWYELPEVFEYQLQRGAARIRNENVTNQVLELWNSRNE